MGGDDSPSPSNDGRGVYLRSAESRAARVAELSRLRSRDWFLRISALVVGGAVFWAWFTSHPLLGRLSASRRWTNLQRFSEGLIPSPVRKSGDWVDALPWAWDLFTDEGFIALVTTIGIATAAIILAGAAVLPFLPLASRRLSRVDPFGLRSGRASGPVAFGWRLLGPVVRFFFVLSRSVPEYLIAFLLLSLLGLQVWPLVLALAIHNFGILGRLWGEVIENTDDDSAVDLYVSGLGRSSVYATSILPRSLNRFLIYFFYRWETCIKDATVLGMLGLLTLGKLIMLSKGFFWDRMLFYVLLGASFILVMDLSSTWLRKRLR